MAFKLRIQAGTLNIRKEPRVGAPAVGQLLKGMEATATELIPLEGRQWAMIGEERFVCTYDNRMRYCDVIPIADPEPPAPSGDALDDAYNQALDDVHAALVRLRK